MRYAECVLRYVFGYVRNPAVVEVWWRWEELNLRHGAYETPALPLSYTADPGNSRTGAGRDFTADTPIAPENMRSEDVLAIIRRDNPSEGVFTMPFRKHLWHDDVEWRQNDTAEGDDAEDGDDLDDEDAEDEDDDDVDDDDDFDDDDLDDDDLDDDDLDDLDEDAADDTADDGDDADDSEEDDEDK